MSSDKGSTPTAPSQTSTDTSPTENRGAPSRFQPITPDDGEGDTERTGSIRRNRPPAISTSSMSSFNTAQEGSQAGEQTPTQDDSRQKSAGSSIRQHVVTPEPTSSITKPVKPPMGRRMSSKLQAPHKGQEFSVDDDPTEYESDQTHRRPSVAKAASGYGPNLRRQPSTLRKRPTVQPTSLPRVDSQEEEDDTGDQGQKPIQEALESPETSGEEGTIQAEVDGDDEGDDDLSDAESFTLKDRQQAINQTHPFGIRIWKPALYKKNRSVEKTAEVDIHSSPGGRVSKWLWTFNVLWTVLFGWWLAVAAMLGALSCLAMGFMPGTMEYGHVLWGLSWYLLFPFGQFVKLEQDEAYAEEDEGQGRPISEYEQWQSGDLEDGRLFFGPLTARSLIGRRRSSLESADEVDSLLGRSRRGEYTDDRVSRTKRRLFGRVGTKYWKYTIDGTNIFLINLIGVVLFAIFDYWVLDVALGFKSWLVHPGFVFALALFSIIPLAYFIGQAVASISAQSSMGVGAAINAFFSTVVEVFLYCVALNQGKGQLVEGSIIGSIFAGILFLPGLSMCFGAIKRKTQRFNVRSAGVTSTMLLFATIAAFGPTLFYQIYGSHELNCRNCFMSEELDSDCRRCYFSQVPAINDQFFIRAVRPYCWFAAVLLFLSYVIGLWFTLRTHAAVIWNTELEEKKGLPHNGLNGSISHQPGEVHSTHPVKQQHSGSSKGTVGRNDIRDSQLYKRILGQSLNQVGIRGGEDSRQPSASGSAPLSQSPNPPYLVPPKSSEGESTVVGDDAGQTSVHLTSLSEEENTHLVRQVAEMAATAATVAARDATKNPRKVSAMTHTAAHNTPRASAPPTAAFRDDRLDESVIAENVTGHAGNSGGHDAPNWSRLKSSVILLSATVLYAVIAEILVNTVDVVLESVDVDEKFLGITLFALVPNTTEFLNAISFAMNGNIALSMEIGSAYALQVCLLQIPALVLFSAVHGQFIDPADLIDHTFNLIFPQWDMVTVILCVFLLSYMCGEGKVNFLRPFLPGYVRVLT
ncbi:MAG: hypothetical protein Q9167_000239 [Letrouitia subvulpina]